MNLVSNKLIGITEDESSNQIYDGDFRACDFEVDKTGVFIKIKCYNSREKKKYRCVRICLTDILFQIFRKLDNEQIKEIKEQIDQMPTK